MSEERIPHADGSVTIHDDHYGFGSINVGPPTRPEPVRVEPVKLTDTEICKRYPGMTPREAQGGAGPSELPQWRTGHDH